MHQKSALPPVTTLLTKLVEFDIESGAKAQLASQMEALAQATSSAPNKCNHCQPYNIISLDLHIVPFLFDAMQQVQAVDFFGRPIVPKRSPDEPSKPGIVYDLVL